jgi:hypothetical protein
MNPTLGACGWKCYAVNEVQSRGVVNPIGAKALAYPIHWPGEMKPVPIAGSLNPPPELAISVFFMISRAGTIRRPYAEVLL